MKFRSLHFMVSGIGRAEQEEKWHCEIDSPMSALQLTSNDLKETYIRKAQLEKPKFQSGVTETTVIQ